MRFRCLLTVFLLCLSLSLFAQEGGHYTQGMHAYSAAIQSHANRDLNKAIEQITSAAGHFHEVKRLKETEVKSLLLLTRWLNERNGDGDLDNAILAGEKYGTRRNPPLHLKYIVSLHFSIAVQIKQRRLLMPVEELST